jgi:hypothetical protein
VDSRFSLENATTHRSIFRKSGLPVFLRKCDRAKEAFSGKVDFRLSLENATTQNQPDAKPRGNPPGLCSLQRACRTHRSSFAAQAFAGSAALRGGLKAR